MLRFSACVNEEYRAVNNRASPKWLVKHDSRLLLILGNLDVNSPWLVYNSWQSYGTQPASSFLFCHCQG